MLSIKLASDHLYGKWLFTWQDVAGEVFYAVLFGAVIFPTRYLWWDLGLNWVSSCEFSYLFLQLKQGVL